MSATRLRSPPSIPSPPLLVKMRPKFLSALLFSRQSISLWVLERNSLVFRTGFWQVGRSVLSACPVMQTVGLWPQSTAEGLSFWVSSLVVFPTSSLGGHHNPSQSGCLPLPGTSSVSPGGPWLPLEPGSGQIHPPTWAFRIFTSWSPDFHSWIFHRLNIASVY